VTEDAEQIKEVRRPSGEGTAEIALLGYSLGNALLYNELIGAAISFVFAADL
jgi:hypothetical protein